MLRLFLPLLMMIALVLTGARGAWATDVTLERILKNNEINCAVYVLGSIFSYGKDGKPTGFTVDLMNEVSKRTGIKVRYTEITSFGTLRQDLDMGKMDMICAPVLLIPATAFGFLPGKLMTIDQINIYADGEADVSGIKTLADLNDPKYTFVGMDGELGGLYVPRLFPKAKLNLLSQGSLPTQMFMELHTKKADFVVLSKLAEKAYSLQNPGKLKRVTNESLLRPSVRQFYPSTAHQLKANIDAILDELEAEGILDRLLTQYNLKY
jgi:ABC-type amino acid transport substrate-binding protein